MTPRNLRLAILVGVISMVGAPPATSSADANFKACQKALTDISVGAEPSTMDMKGCFETVGTYDFDCSGFPTDC